MDLEGNIRAALLKVLTTIQSSSGHELPELTDSLKPLEDLDDFDSEVWPIASGMLQVELGINIPAKTNIFRDPVSRKALTVGQIVGQIAKCFAQWSVPKLVASAT